MGERVFIGFVLAAGHEDWAVPHVNKDGVEGGGTAAGDDHGGNEGCDPEKERQLVDWTKHSWEVAACYARDPSFRERNGDHGRFAHVLPFQMLTNI